MGKSVTTARVYPSLFATVSSLPVTIMEWYAQVGWTVLGVFAAMYFLYDAFVKPGNGRESAHASPRPEIQRSNKETFQEKDEEGENEVDLIACETDSRHTELLRRVVQFHRDCTEPRGEEWRLTKVRSLQTPVDLEKDGMYLVSGVMCCGDKCQMATYTAVKNPATNTYTVVRGDNTASPVSDERGGAPTKEGGGATTLAKTPDKTTPTTPGGSIIPLWPDPKTPVSFGSYRKVSSTTGTWNASTPSSRRTRISTIAGSKKSEAQSSVTAVTEDIPVGVRPIKVLSEYHSLVEKAGTQYPIVVDFYADWCGPCQRMKPVFEQMATAFAGRAYFCSVDTDEAKDIARVCSIRSLPTFFVIKSGHVMERIQGANVDALRDAVVKHARRATEVDGLPARSSQADRLDGRYGLSTLGIDEAYLPCIGTTPELFVSSADLLQIDGKITELNTLLKESVRGAPYALLVEEVNIVHDLVSMLKESNRWHANKVDRKHIRALEQLLQWPSHLCYPVLDLCRIVFLHPSSEAMLLSHGSFGGSKLVGLILEHASREINVPGEAGADNTLEMMADRNCRLSLRCAVNLFKFRRVWELCAENSAMLLELCISNFSASRQDRSLREAIGKLLLNLSLVQFAFPVESDALIPGKVILFATLLIGLVVNDKASKVSVLTIRCALQAIGTTVYSCRKKADILSAGTRQSIAVATASLLDIGLGKEVQALHKILALVPRSTREVEELPNPWTI